MSTTDQPTTDLLPKAPIRRFDVFAEYSRQERLAKGDPEDVAKGYGIWIAKVVAARRFGKKSGAEPGEHTASRRKMASAEAPESKFHSVGDELQTDQTFDHDIIDRMGDAFYDDVFAPAIAAAREQGAKYEEIRDSIRGDWKPAKAPAKARARTETSEKTRAQS